MRNSRRKVVTAVLDLDDWWCERNEIDKFIFTAYVTFAAFVFVHVRTESQAAAVALVLDGVALAAFALVGVAALQLCRLLAFVLSALW